MKFIKGFNGLRALSIILVLLTHLGVYDRIKNPFVQKNLNLFSGLTGVTIFFAISGFLITRLLLNEKAKNGRINFKNFFIRRFLRLLPPLLVFFVAIALLMKMGLISRSYISLAVSFFYLYNFIPVRYYVMELGHTWTLGVEEQFYLFWPFFINRVRKGILFPAIIIFLCIVCAILYPHLLFDHGKPYYLADHFRVYRWFIPACLPIMIGSITSILLFRNEGYIREKVSKNYGFLAVSLLLFVAQALLPDWLSGCYIVLQPLGASLFLLWVFVNQSSRIVRILEFGPVSFLGKISYGIYVYQGLFLRTGPGGTLSIQQFPLNICLVFLTAILSYYLVEQPCMRLKKGFGSMAPSLVPNVPPR